MWHGIFLISAFVISVHAVGSQSLSLLLVAAALCLGFIIATAFEVKDDRSWIGAIAFSLILLGGFGGVIWRVLQWLAVPGVLIGFVYLIFRK